MASSKKELFLTMEKIGEWDRRNKLHLLDFLKRDLTLEEPNDGAISGMDAIAAFNGNDKKGKVFHGAIRQLIVEFVEKNPGLSVIECSYALSQANPEIAANRFSCNCYNSVHNGHIKRENGKLYSMNYKSNVRPLKVKSA